MKSTDENQTLRIFFLVYIIVFQFCIGLDEFISIITEQQDKFLSKRSDIEKYIVILVQNCS